MMIWPPANAIYRRETYDNYPAAKAILHSVYEGLQLPMDQALTVEARWFAHILRSKEAAAMIRSLFLSKNELDKGAHRPKDVPPTNLKKIGILGAGFMGAGVAYVSASNGLEVVLLDRDQESADKGKAGCEKLIAGQVSRGRATAADQAALLARIEATADYARLKGCDLVLEAVFEDRGVKAEATRRAQEAVGPDVVFASNTSTLPITSLAQTSARPDNFIGIHFFSPVEKMLLVEIILGKETGDVALATALDFVRILKKTPIVVNDSRGFFANRCVLNYVREGQIMLIEGVPAAMIENVARMAGMPVGPLSLNDEVGLDLGWKILQAAKKDLGPMAVDPAQERVLEFMVERNGRFGRKNGKGFYDYPASGKKTLWPGLAELADNKIDPGTLDVTELKRTLPCHTSGGSRAHHRGACRHRPARGRCRLDPRLWLRAVHRWGLVLYRRHGRKGLRRTVRRSDRQAWRALRAAALAARNGGGRRDVLSPLQGGMKRAYWSPPCRQQPTR